MLSLQKSDNYRKNDKEKNKQRFYNRETIAASNYKIHQMSFIPPQINKPFPNLRISANYDKADGVSANGKFLLQGIVSLLCNLLYSNIAVEIMKNYFTFWVHQ